MLLQRIMIYTMCDWLACDVQIGQAAAAVVHHRLVALGFGVVDALKEAG